MSNPLVTFGTLQVVIPANTTVSYGNSGVSPNNYYAGSVTYAGTTPCYLTVANGWSMINNNNWNGPTFDITNESSSAITCNLQVISIGPDSSQIKLLALK